MAEIVRCLLSGRAGGEERLLIVPQQADPVLDVAGVAQLAVDGKFGAQERGGKLGDQLLCRVLLVAKARLEIAIKTGLVSGPMTKFVEQRAVEIRGILERPERWHRDAIDARHIASLAASLSD